MPRKEPRNYKAEYSQYHGKPGPRKRRSKVNQARRKLGLKNGDSRVVDHKKPLSKGGSNSRANLRVVSKELNHRKGNRNA